MTVDASELRIAISFLRYVAASLVVLLKILGESPFGLFLLYPIWRKKIQWIFRERASFFLTGRPGGGTNMGFIEQGDFPRLAVDVGHIHRGTVEAHHPPPGDFPRSSVDFFRRSRLALSKGRHSCPRNRKASPALFRRRIGITHRNDGDFGGTLCDKGRAKPLPCWACREPTDFGHLASSRPVFCSPRSLAVVRPPMP